MNCQPSCHDSYRLICPAVQACWFRDVMLQKKAFDLLFYADTFISELITKTNDLFVNFLLFVWNCNFYEQILCGKLCELSTVEPV